MASDARLVEDLFGGLMRKAFPLATELELYGASIKLRANGDMVLVCGGERKYIYGSSRT